MSSIVQCHQLNKSYAGKKALNNVSFEITAGDPVALVGPNGAGKTTLLSILSGFLRPSSGTLSLFACRPGSAALFGRVSALPQDARFDPGFTISRQLSLYARLQGMSRIQAGREAERVLELMRLQEFADAYPGVLSHGMCKRLAIAQALLGKPELVLLDEPTAGLDPANARNIRQIVSELSCDTTFIISSHNLSELERLCQTVLYLDQGNLQISTVSAEGEISRLSLQMDSAVPDRLIELVSALEGVKSVVRQQKNELLVQYEQQLAPALDQQLLACLAQHNWSYRQLTKGKTLEDRLFTDMQ